MVTDLPERFMKALLAAMVDKSYSNYDSASFAAKHSNKEKMYHLWIDHADKDKRFEDDAFRFVLQIVGLDNGYSEESEYDFVNYMDSSIYVLDILITNKVDELAKKLCTILPSFNEEYNIGGLA
jgi:hypothetical protein